MGTVEALYQDRYKELIDIGEISAAEKIACYVCDVDCGLKYAERKHLDLESIGYDLPTIALEQHNIHEEYRKKSECLDLSM